jgi:predicted ferric reductase
MWALFAAALLAALYRWSRLRPRIFRLAHTATVCVAVAGSVAHALLIEGTMGDLSKAVLCILVVLALIRTIAGLRTWTLLLRRRRT